MTGESVLECVLERGVLGLRSKARTTRPGVVRRIHRYPQDSARDRAMGTDHRRRIIHPRNVGDPAIVVRPAPIIVGEQRARREDQGDSRLLPIIARTQDKEAFLLDLRAIFALGTYGRDESPKVPNVWRL